MKKATIVLLLVLFCITVLGANFGSYVPTDVDYVVRLANLGRLTGILEGLVGAAGDESMDAEEQLEGIPDLSGMLVEGAELILFGNIGLNLSLLDLDLDRVEDAEILGLLLSQPIGIITNLLPEELVGGFIEEMLSEDFSENEIRMGTESINGHIVKTYSLNILEDFPPIIGNIYLFSDEEKLILTSDRRVLEKTLLAIDNANYRLEEVSQAYRNLLREESNPVFSWYNGGLEVGWLILRSLGINYGQPVAETLTLGIDEEFNLKVGIKFDLDYYSSYDLNQALLDNKPVEYFKKLPVPEAVDTLLAMKSGVVNLLPLVGLIEDVMNISEIPAIENIGEMITIPVVFGNKVNYSSIWLGIDDPEEKTYMYFETEDVKGSIDVFARLVEEEAFVQGDNYVITNPDAYVAGPIGGNWFEISSFVPENIEVIPVRDSLPTFEEKYPEIISSIEKHFSGVSTLVFNPNILLYYRAYDLQGDLHMKLEVPLMSLVEIITQLSLSGFDDYDDYNDYGDYDDALASELYEIVISNDMDALREKVEDEFIYLDMPLDGWDNTALHLAIEYGYEEMAEYLVNNYAYLDAQNFDGETPLIVAVNYGRFEMVKLLVDNYAYLDEVDYYNGTAILYAVVNNNEEIVKYLMDNWANPAVSDTDGFTPLMAAAQNGNLNLVRLFVEYGVELNSVDYYGYTAIEYAKENGYNDVAAYLRDNGAEE